MRFHREGRMSILIASLVSIAIILGVYYAFGRGSVFQPVAFGLATILMITILQFFRYPRRRLLSIDDVILAPADGKVVVIEEVQDDEYFKKKVRQVSIFMSPVNVHINWHPLSGEVVYSKYHPGKYLVAWHPKSSTDNERHSIVTKNALFGEVMIKQIAGALARRIVNYATVGSTVQQGDELGFIKFGSRVDILLPLEAKIEVDLDQKTIGGQTIIASLKQQ